MGARVDTLFKFFSFSCSWHLSHILICNCVVVVLELSTVLSALFIRNVIVVLLTDFGFLFLFATVLGRNILFLFWFRLCSHCQSPWLFVFWLRKLKASRQGRRAGEKGLGLGTDRGRRGPDRLNWPTTGALCNRIAESTCSSSSPFV